MNLLYPVVALLVCLAASRHLGERALRQLTPGEKVRLVDGFSGLRRLGWIPTGILLVGYLGLPSAFPEGPGWVGHLGLAGFVVGLVWINVHVARRLSALGFPGEFVRGVLLARSVGYLGLALFLAGMFVFAARRAAF